MNDDSFNERLADEKQACQVFYANGHGPAFEK
jgi:hypothetical protein